MSLRIFSVCREASERHFPDVSGHRAMPDPKKGVSHSHVSCAVHPCNVTGNDRCYGHVVTDRLYHAGDRHRYCDCIMPRMSYKDLALSNDPSPMQPVQLSCIDRKLHRIPSARGSACAVSADCSDQRGHMRTSSAVIYNRISPLYRTKNAI